MIRSALSASGKRPRECITIPPKRMLFIPIKLSRTV
jgi:hypothetical protein